ncbi:MAG: FAD-binding oxidoreductase [Longimicrobiales bacterium]|nr:FAD-binding oxidoreductase [Longimicrobiales bacterium]
MSDKTYDLVIVGAGSLGVPTALYASRAGLRTLVLDRLASPGQGENKAAIGGTRATHSDPAKILICLRSLEVFRNWKEKEGDDIGWRQGGYLFPVYREATEKTLRNLLPVQHAHGLNIDWIGPEAVEKLVPGIREVDLRGASYSPEDGNLSPLKTVNAFYFAAVRAGAEFRFRETVQRIEVESGRVSRVVTDQGSYATRLVLNAAGSAAAEIGRMVGLDLPVHPDSHEGGVTEPVERFFDPLVVDLRTTPGSKNCYFYQDSDNRIVFCLTPDPIYPGTDRQSHSSFLPIVSRKMVDLLPRLAGIRVRRVWRGCYPQTPDASPVVGEAPETRGYYFGVGLCGQGLMLGPGLAEDLVSLMTTGTTVTEEKAWNLLRLERDFGKTEALK